VLGASNYTLLAWLNNRPFAKLQGTRTILFE
jgi:hypothetical protein